MFGHFTALYMKGLITEKFQEKQLIQDHSCVFLKAFHFVFSNNHFLFYSPTTSDRLTHGYLDPYTSTKVTLDMIKLVYDKISIYVKIYCDLFQCISQIMMWHVNIIWKIFSEGIKMNKSACLTLIQNINFLNICMKISVF